MNVSTRITNDVRPGTAYVPYFIREMISEFLLAHTADLAGGEDSVIPVRIERV
jgi:formate dehydrogenase major subunit